MLNREPVLFLALFFCLALPAQAAKFELGSLDGTFNTNLSVGASWRMENADNGVITPGNKPGKGKASSSTADDGNLNYDKGDMYSLIFKGIHELELSKNDTGIFTRVKYWYDYAVEELDVNHGTAANNYRTGEPLKTSGYDDLSKPSGFEFLDYYAFTSFTVGDMPVELRAGNMVLSWGESTFIQNGLNVISPFDVAALRRPGTEIKEGLLPVGLLYANVGLTENLSLETFYQYHWEKTIVDECGSYWSGADPYGGGCSYLTATNTLSDVNQIGTPYIIARAADDEASDTGQWGIALRYFAESLNATEFGLYFENLHSRTPIFSGYNTDENLGGNILLNGTNPSYFFEYPEDIKLFGATFATNVGDWAWSGEVSYRPEYPLQINTVELLQAIALGSSAVWDPMVPRSLAAGPGGYVSGYDEVKYTQVQTTLIKFFEQVLGASRLSFATEIGAAFISGMDDNLNYGRSSAYGIAGFDSFNYVATTPPPGTIAPIVPDGTPISCNGSLLGIIQPNTNADYCNDNGFTDDFSWGYRVAASLEYSNVFAGINLTPNIAWSHDVQGTSPSPNFIDKRKAASLGVKADYLNIYRFDLSYTTYFGADYNELQDRDFISASFSASF